MKILVYGAGVIGTLLAVRLHEAGNEVELLARGARLAALREKGVVIAEGESGPPRRVPVPVVDRLAGPYDLIAVLVRSHQVDEVLKSLAETNGDVLFMVNWAAGPAPLAEALGADRVLLGFPAEGGTMEGDVVRYRAASPLTRLVSIPIGEPDGRSTARVERIIQTFRSAGLNAKLEPRGGCLAQSHAAFEVPLGQAVHAAGGREPLARDADAIRAMIQSMRKNLEAMQARPVPRAFTLLQVVPERVLVTVFRRFLRSDNASKPLDTDTPAVTAELDRLSEQLRTSSRDR